MYISYYWHRYLFRITYPSKEVNCIFPMRKVFLVFGMFNKYFFFLQDFHLWNYCMLHKIVKTTFNREMILPRVVHKYFCFLAQSTHASRLFQLTQNWNQVIAQSTLLKETKKHSLIALIDNLDLFIITYICCVQWRSIMHPAFKTCQVRTLNLLSK